MKLYNILTFVLVLLQLYLISKQMKETEPTTPGQPGTVDNQARTDIKTIVSRVNSLEKRFNESPYNI